MNYFFLFIQEKNMSRALLDLPIFFFFNHPLRQRVQLKFRSFKWKILYCTVTLQSSSQYNDLTVNDINLIIDHIYVYIFKKYVNFKLILIISISTCANTRLLPIFHDFNIKIQYTVNYQIFHLFLFISPFKIIFLIEGVKL